MMAGKIKNHPSSWKWVFRYLYPVWMKMSVLTLLILTSTGLSLVNPLIVQQFINLATGKGALSSLISLAVIYLIVAVVNQVVTVVVTYLGGDVAWRATNHLRSDLLQHCLRLDLTFHNQRTPGEMIERVDGDVTALSNFFSQFMVKILGSVVLLLGILVVMIRTDWHIGLMMIGFTMGSLVVLLAIRNVGVHASSGERQSSAELFGLIEERLAGIEDVQANGATGYVMNRYYRAMRTYFLKGRRAWMLRVIPFNVTNALYGIGMVMVLGYGVTMYLHHGMSLGTLYLFYQYTQMLGDPLDQLGNQLQDYQRAKSSLRRVRELLSLDSAIQDGPGVELPQGPLAIEFDDVTFGYAADEPVLHGVSFQLEAGEVVGVVGRTGSGKSSLTRLLLRLYNMQSGAVRLGGVDIRQLTLHELYRRVGMVTQDVQLFEATVRDNVTLFNAAIRDEEILETVQRLGLKDWIDRLPDGLSTPLTAGGASLSAGEAQLLALTRVFLTKPSLVILDEPSSRLDPATELLLQSAVNQLLQECTGIMIAHRLTTLDKVDKILVLSQGRVLEYGNRQELINDEMSRFSRLLQTELQEVLA
jgi:ATP-binding cassette subfamily B protein